MILGIIPARYASTRFPGKPLVDLLGKTMIRRVYERASRSKLIKKLVVATDDRKIFDHVTSFGGHAVMTSGDHASGTERCHEAFQQINEPFDYVINIQGDEPLVAAEQIDELAAVLDGKIELATQIMKLTDPQALFQPSVVKVILNARMEALYFSRSAIPHIRNVSHEEWPRHYNFFRHAGMYAYRSDVLEKIVRLPASSLEKAESLEQLRWLQHGFKIKCIITNFQSLSVDTPEDVAPVIERLRKE
ncbi:MAG TPA: 3-deoxy-manno-octulosonate cytidylyltransferase [Chitinophagaceae bacterium]|nr:3-deoxy-manno-octulosonate cytidylyltransferase [Chitinophagaceae bacterium]